MTFLSSWEGSHVIFYLVLIMFVLIFAAVIMERFAMRKYFTEYTLFKSALYSATLVFVLSTCVVVVLETVFTDDQICEKSWITDQQRLAMKISYKNPSYVYNPCDHMRLPALMFLTRKECLYGRNLLWSVFLGGFIGWERREADRPAGIRTMSLVSLGACLFSLNSMYAFIDGPMSWDSSRVSAAIPSGVGFLGAGLIFKEADKDEITGDTRHVVHGLTTAASVWMSAAVGVACAGSLYFAAAFTVALILTLLRFGPRQQDLDNEEEDFENSMPQLNKFRYRGESTGTTISAGAPKPHHSATLSDGIHTELNNERRPLVTFDRNDKADDEEEQNEQEQSRNMRVSMRASMRASMRKRATLGGIV